MTPVLREIADELPSTLAKAALLAFCMLGYRSLLTMLGTGFWSSGKLTDNQTALSRAGVTLGFGAVAN